MAGTTRQIGPFLVDPELLSTSWDHAFDRKFWKRINRVPDFGDYAYIGCQTLSIYDDFYIFCCDHMDELSERTGDSVGEFTYLLSSIYEIKHDDAPTASDGSYAIPDGSYLPVFGTPECALALSADLGDLSDPCTIVDRKSWPGFEGGSGRLMGDVLLVDIDAGPEECVRALIREDPSYATIRELAPLAFPNLTFCDESWGTLKDIRANERRYAPKIVRCLSALSDHALSIWGDERNPKRWAPAMLRHGVDCSPEKGHTMTVKPRVEERTFTYGGESFTMEWHAKFEHDRGRMYFEVQPGKKRVLIGGFTTHFDTR